MMRNSVLPLILCALLLAACTAGGKKPAASPKEVLSDELVIQFKNKAPVIPLSERMEILAAIRDVDEVVAITDSPSRILEWDRRPFDCFFSGDDYRGNSYWEWEREELRKRGSDIVFFPYTEEQSSTQIREKLK